ncbi:MAG: alpha/beta hydrolase [Chthoniobacterales bacterium]
MKRWLKFTFGFLLLLFVALYGITSWIGAGWLLAPPRNPPQTWQLDMLGNPRNYGLRIERSISAAGVPYLLCVPDASAGPGRRGGILRMQLGNGAPPYGDIRGTVVLLHGWTMRKEGLLAVAERFCAAGLRCVIPDLPGHGESPSPTAGFGARAGERLLPGEVLESASRRFNFPSRPAVLWGLSMGGAYALQAATAQPELWSTVVVVSSFDALEPVVHGQVDSSAHGLGSFLRPGLAVAVRIRGGFWPGDACPVESARRLQVPAFIVHGTSDDLIPPSCGRRIYEAIPTPRKRWLAVDGALHGNVLGTPQHVFVEMSGWFLTWIAPLETKHATASVKHSP